MTTLTPNFRTMADQAEKGLVVAPLLYGYLYEAKFPDLFDVTFRKHGNRAPDGWFHPSSHPTMTARQLYYYMTEPERWEEEHFSFQDRMAVVMGTAVHSFIEACLYDLKILVPPTGMCPACARPHGFKKNQCGEHGVADPVLKRRGHMDGVLQTPQTGMGGFEFKTGIPFSVAKLVDNDVETFKAKYPYYYSQVQEYMDISGLPFFIVVFITMGRPWELREFRIDYDPAHAKKTRDKYAMVRYHEKIGTPPDPCCAPRSKESRACPATNCPVRSL